LVALKGQPSRVKYGRGFGIYNEISIAWIDCVPKRAQLGRSRVFLGEHATRHELRGRLAENYFASLGDPKLSMPIDFPGLALNPFPDRLV
jgi:decaprenylphospho-beta-D-ribofuranose 2-oxidase